MELKTIENILNKYVIEAPSMGRSVILADRIDEVAEEIHLQLLQQTPCTAHVCRCKEPDISVTANLDKVCTICWKPARQIA